MPYGYKQFRSAKGISERTLHSEVQLIDNFIAYTNTIHKKYVDPTEYTSKDVKDFLLSRKAHGIKDSTLKKDLTHLKQFFDYLWQQNRIPVDFTTKIKLDLHIIKTEIYVDYSFLLNIYKNVLLNPRLQPKAQALFMFYMRGWRMRDIREIRLDDVKDNGNKLTIEIKKDNGCKQSITFKGAEIEPIIYCQNESIFRNVPYLFSSKIKGEYEQFSIYSAKTYLNSIVDEYSIDFPLKNDTLRFAYVHYLYTEKKLSLEEIANVLGISLSNAANLLKQSLERIKPREYNEERTII